MATRIKSSAMRRRVKRRGERASYKKNAIKTLRSRKQRGRNTARKVMRGGAEVIQIFIDDSQGKRDTSEPAVTLTFTNTNTRLVLTINLDKYRGSVRKLLHHLFTIGDIDPATLNYISPFLMGLADGPARHGTTEKALEHARRNCNYGGDKIIKDMTEKILSNTTCNLEIELSEKDGNIVFTVKKYDRLKFDTTSCETYSTAINREKGTRERVTTKVDIFYPILEFASSNPFVGGVDYIDYNSSQKYLRDILAKGNKDNLFRFTVIGKTIENLKQELKKKTIMVDRDGNLTTLEKEKQKLEQEADDAAKKAEKEKYEKEQRDARDRVRGELALEKRRQDEEATKEMTKEEREAYYDSVYAA